MPDLPADIDPESGSRLPLPRRDDLPEAAREIFDRLAGPHASSLVGLYGPGGLRLHSPDLAVRTDPVNRYLRWETDLSGEVREIAILVTARAHDSQFEWAQHEPAALAEGVSPETVEVIRTGAPLDGLDETVAAAIALGRELFGARRVSPETYARAHAAFGTRGLVDLVSLMGMYAATAALLAAFDVQLRPGQEARLPEDEGTRE